MDNQIVQKFGRFATRSIQKNPAFARRLLADVFRGYGSASLHSRTNGELHARNYLLWCCNRMMARSLTTKGDTALVSIFTPCEFLHAMDIDIVFPEGLSCYMTASACEEVFLNQAEANGVQESYCSYHKQLLGIADLGIMPKPTCIVNTTMICDANQLTFRYLAEKFHVPHFVLDIPHNDNGANERYVASQLREMVKFLEASTGRTMDPERLRSVMRRAERSIQKYRKILELKADRHETTKMTSHMMDSFGMHVLLGTEGTEQYTDMMIHDLSELPKSTPGVRIVWVHTLPYWQQSMCRIFNYNDRVEVVGCDMCFDHLDVDLDADYPYESLAAQLMKDSFNGPAERRLDRVLRYARQLRADGIIYFCHWGCKQTIGSSAIAKRKFEAAGLPTLTLDGDGCDPRNIQDGQMVTRVGAFIEQLEAAKFGKQGDRKE